MKSERTIKLSATDVETIIKDLSLLVVSLDRMGSTYYKNRNQRAIALDEFMDANLFKLLARDRGILDEAYDSQSSKADIARLEEEAETLPYWQCEKS